MNARMYSDDCGLPWLALAALWAGVFVVTVGALEVGSRAIATIQGRNHAR